MKFKIKEKYLKLETIEEKSFWVIAPAIAFLGLTGLTTAGFYASALPTISSAFLCLVIPVILMFIVYKYKNYHYAYPLLCVFIGAVSIPLTFVFSGGFLSGMPLFCVVSSSITALCYSNRWRRIAIVCCLLGNTAAFYYVYKFGSPFPLQSTIDIYTDMMYAYYFTSLGTYSALSLIINEIRKYKVSQEALQQYFDIEVRKEIISKALNGELSITNQNQKVVILFADISNFTTITEKMSSEKIAQFLNEFFSIAAKHIHNRNGIIDKYIGDCVMAYWFDQDDKNCVLEAIKTVFDIKKELAENSELIFDRYETELSFSAGISYGDVIFGEIGSESMHNYTLIGDAVNTASRIEDYAVAGELLISNNAALKVKEYVQLENVEHDIYFKGKNEPINLYRVIGLLDEEKNNETVLFEETNGYSLYICGCRGSFPVSGVRFSEYGGETSCYVIKKDDYAVIVDCGTGLKNAVDILSDVKKIDILLTHVHYDHILGLLMSKLPDIKDIHVYSYFGGWEANSKILENFMEHPYWPIGIIKTDNIDVELEKEIVLDKDIKAIFYKSDHPDEACVIRVECKDKNICFFSDCEDPNKLNPASYDKCDLVFFDGMFDDNDIVDHTGWGHGTWQQGVRFAQTHNINKIIITHHNPEVGDHTLHMREDTARSIYTNASFAKAGDRLLL